MPSKRLFFLSLFIAFSAVLHAHAGTLDDVRQRGVVRCGVAPNNPGFAYTDAQGAAHGFDVDLCRAVAVAIFDDPTKADLKPVEPRDAFTLLTTGGIDVLTDRFTWTFSRDNGSGMQFTGTDFYDGQAFMVRKSLGVTSVTQLNGATICAAQGTTTELNVADWFRQHNLTYKIVTFNGTDATRLAYDGGRCDAWTDDRASMAARRLGLKDPGANIVLPETISKEPIGPIVRDNDPQWAHLVRWVVFATIEAEELGLTAANVDAEAKSTTNPEAKRFLGTSDDFGQKLGLSRAWAYDIVQKLGNYGEIYDRNVGDKSPIGLSRGLNALWTKGGLMISPPFR
jgi:general L-amino acid transport system substrate-binding protein